MRPPVTIGVSACLLGEHVRYDGNHKHDRCIIANLAGYFSFTPVCPEVGCGLPVPREAMRLEGDPAAPRLMTCRTRIDRTEQLLAYCAERIRALENENISGFIFKERSPSCGLADVPIHGSGISDTGSVGLFAREVARSFPLLPLEEAERLNNPHIRKDFVARVFLYSRRNGALSNEFSDDHSLLKS